MHDQNVNGHTPNGHGQFQSKTENSGNDGSTHSRKDTRSNITDNQVEVGSDQQGRDQFSGNAQNVFVIGSKLQNGISKWNKNGSSNDIDNRNYVKDQPSGLLGSIGLSTSHVKSCTDPTNGCTSGTQGSRPRIGNSRNGRRRSNGSLSETTHQDSGGLRSGTLKEKCTNVGQGLLHEFLGSVQSVMLEGPSVIGPCIQVILFDDKHVNVVHDRLARPRDGKRNGRTNESETVPMFEWTTKDKDPVQQSIDK
mmetsp:Transcript_3008/g.7073  ORF Transcript_3008/g.7073 Transcript_3008/m.7073 type:complete len:251 (-) Transcript_3008:763-1515(-)